MIGFICSRARGSAGGGRDSVPWPACHTVPAEIGLLVLATSTGSGRGRCDRQRAPSFLPSISRVVVNFMGCAAAMNALGTAPTMFVPTRP